MSSQSISFALPLSVLLEKALLANGLHGKFISLLITLCKKKKKRAIIKRIHHKFPGRIRRSNLKKKKERGGGKNYTKQPITTGLTTKRSALG